jgi:predicted transcriptional regulator of viral defense system
VKLIDAQVKLKSFGQTFIHSTDAAAILQVPRSHASKIMTRLAESGVFVQLTRGRWALTENVDRFTVPEFLVSPSLSYISMQSALFFHGMISQVPEAIYAVSNSKTRKYRTKVGTFSIHHLEPEFFFGFEVVGDRQIKIATPEKALLDFFYLSPGRSRIFHALPEVELPVKFSSKKAIGMADEIRSKSRRAIVKEALRLCLEKNGR